MDKKVQWVKKICDSCKISQFDRYKLLIFHNLIIYLIYRFTPNLANPNICISGPKF